MAFVDFAATERQEFGALAEAGFVFDWTQSSSASSLVVGAIHNSDICGLVEFEHRPEGRYNFLWLIEVADRYKGGSVAGELLAYVGQDSLLQGFEGFVLLEAKTKLFHYFQMKYGAKPARGRYLFFDTEATRQLITRYLGGDGDGAHVAP
jgi:hypothetical protein